MMVMDLSNLGKKPLELTLEQQFQVETDKVVNDSDRFGFGFLVLGREDKCFRRMHPKDVYKAAKLMRNEYPEAFKTQPQPKKLTAKIHEIKKQTP